MDLGLGHWQDLTDHRFDRSMNGQDIRALEPSLLGHITNANEHIAFKLFGGCGRFKRALRQDHLRLQCASHIIFHHLERALGVRGPKDHAELAKSPPFEVDPLLAALVKANELLKQLAADPAAAVVGAELVVWDN